MNDKSDTSTTKNIVRAKENEVVVVQSNASLLNTLAPAAWGSQANGHRGDPYANARTVEEALAIGARHESAFARYQSNAKLEISRANDMEYITGQKWSSLAYHVAMREQVSWLSVCSTAAGLGCAHIPPLWRIGLKSSSGVIAPFRAINGDPGRGKGSAINAAALAFIYPDVGPFTPVHDSLVSGQAVINCYMQQFIDDDNDSNAQQKAGRPRVKARNSDPWVQVNHSVIIQMTEVSSVNPILSDARGRGYLCQWWSGENIGGRARNATYSGLLQSGTYTGLLEIGVQPTNSMMILDHAGSGLAQRALWVPVQDRTISPEKLALEFKMFQNKPYEPIVLCGVPEIAALDPSNVVARASALEDMRMDVFAKRHRSIKIDESIEDLVQHLSQTKQAGLREVDILDTHRVQVLLKEAAGEAFMANFHGSEHTSITEADVYRADYRLLYSDQERMIAKEEAAAEQKKQAGEQGQLDGVRKTVSNRVVKQQAIFDNQSMETAVKRIASTIAGDPTNRKRTLPSTGMSPSLKRAWPGALTMLSRLGVVKNSGETEKKGRYETIIYTTNPDKIPAEWLNDD